MTDKVAGPDGSELSEKLGGSFRSEAPMACTHTKWVYDPPYEDDWTGEWITPEPRQVSTSVDIDIGRFRCAQCGEVGYYTGLWRDFHEKGIPCPGSDGVRRVPPNAIKSVEEGK